MPVTLRVVVMHKLMCIAPMYEDEMCTQLSLTCAVYALYIRDMQLWTALLKIFGLSLSIGFTGVLQFSLVICNIVWEAYSVVLSTYVISVVE